MLDEISWIITVVVSAMTLLSVTRFFGIDTKKMKIRFKKFLIKIGMANEIRSDGRIDGSK